jgi:carboxyl-terminal processing protease
MHTRALMNKHILLSTLFLYLSSTFALAQSNIDSIDPRPLEVHTDISGRIARIAENLHYERVDLDNALSSEILDSYLDNLDRSRYFLLVTDISSFAQYRFVIDDLTKRGDTSPAFNIFNVYRARVRERIDFVTELLETPMSFNTEESFSFDREDSNWPLNTEDSNELWRKRVKNDALSLTLSGQDWDQIKTTLSSRYNRILESAESIDEDEVFQLFMNSVMRSIDPHSTYFNPRNSEEYEIQMSLSYQGIGATLQLNDNIVTITQVSPGGPAYKSGLINPEDRIIAITQNEQADAIDVIGWELDEVVQLIRGPIGTSVTLHILPQGEIIGSEPNLITLTRDEIKLEEQAAKKEVITVTENEESYTVGVIKVPSFYQDFQARSAGNEDFTSTTRDVQRLVEELVNQESIDGLVIDLRNNGGGHLSEATALTGLFIDEGPVVQIRERRGSATILDDPSRGSIYDGPMVVLINRYSASASEIFAGALQDYGRAVIVGQQTYGKGTVQNMFDLNQFSKNNNYGQLSLTIAKYYRITGESTQHRGVIPDINLPSFIDLSKVGESSEPSAMPWDQISGTPFQRDGKVASLISSLSIAHQRRLNQDPDLLYFNGNIRASETLRSRTEITLSLEERKRDNDLQDAARLQRYNQWRTSTGQETVEDIDQMDLDAIPDFLLDEAAMITVNLIETNDIN